jgi:hypothetical protein
MGDRADVQDPAKIALGPEDRDILARESPTVGGHTCKVMRLGPGAPDATALRELVSERLHLASPGSPTSSSGVRDGSRSSLERARPR